MDTFKLHEEDVTRVASMIGKTLTPEQIQWVIDYYTGYEEQDPTANWSEIVEQEIYDVLN